MTFGFPKDTTYENRRLLDGARDAPCMNCGAQDGTVVAAHDNSLDQKGIGKKGHDCFVAYLCVRCHDFVDGRGGHEDPTGLWFDSKDDKRECWFRAFRKTVLYWARKGWLKPT